jgi:hypothetical protein
VSAYRDLAHRLLREATGTEDPAKAERFKKRANEYLLLADAIEASEPLIMAEQTSSAVQQQHQPQPQDADEE